MRYRWLGKTGLKVSEIGFGAWAIGGSWWGPQDDRDSRLALHKALDMGCNFIDTAWVYGQGHSERLIGGVLRERGERPLVATKVPPQNWNWDNRPGTPLSEAFTPEWMTAKAEESLKNLGVERLDVLQLHTWLQGWDAQAGPLLSAAARLKREGKIRAFGISLRDSGASEANDLIRWRQVDTLQIFFNLFYQEPLGEVFPLARQYGVGVIARVPMAFGALSGRFDPKTRFVGDDHRRSLYAGAGLQATLKKVEKLGFLPSKNMSMAEAALKWTLAYPEVSTSIPGIRNLRQAVLNCSAGDGPMLPPAAVRKAEKLYRSNFSLPIQKVASAQGVHAVFMSGIKVVPSGEAGKKDRSKRAREPIRRQEKTKEYPGESPGEEGEKMIRPWKKNGQRTDYDCGFFQVQVHQSSSPITGKEHPFYILSTRDWVNVVALTKDQRVLMVSQYRHGSGEVSLEIPGGAVDTKNEPPLQAAQRELLEETGYRASEWHSLGKVQPNPAILNNACHTFLAMGAERVADLKLDEAEELEVSLHDVAEIPRMIREGKIQHGLIVAAFHLFDLFKNGDPDKT